MVCSYKKDVYSFCVGLTKTCTHGIDEESINVDILNSIRQSTVIVENYKVSKVTLCQV